MNVELDREDVVQLVTAVNMVIESPNIVIKAKDVEKLILAKNKMITAFNGCPCSAGTKYHALNCPFYPGELQDRK